jgi:hypothetical protein
MAGPITTGTELVNWIPQLWTPGLLQESTEEMVIANDFASPEGVTKIRGQLNIRKIKKQSATALANTVAGTGLTYAQNVEAVVTLTPTWIYAAVELNRQAYNQLDFNPDNDYRDMLKYAIAEYIDQAAGVLAASLSTNTTGTSLASIDKGLILDTEQKLVISCKRKFKPGVTPWYLKVAPTELKNLLNIFDLTADYVRGDAEKPLVSGWMSKALGAKIDETGNIYVASGITHNLAHIDQAFVKAYNEEPVVLPPQAVELVNRIIATCEFGVGEVFDEYAVDVQTKG